MAKFLIEIEVNGEYSKLKTENQTPVSQFWDDRYFDDIQKVAEILVHYALGLKMADPE